jgi:hypothetical protein
METGDWRQTGEEEREREREREREASKKMECMDMGACMGLRGRGASGCICHVGLVMHVHPVHPVCVVEAGKAGQGRSVSGSGKCRGI